MAAPIANVLETYTSLGLTEQGYERVLNVVTDLPIDVRQVGFNAEKLDDFVREIAKLLEPGEFDRATVLYKGDIKIKE